MKTIFVYGILQRENSAKEFGLTDDMYLGRAILEGFERRYLTHIVKTKNGNSVEGDLFKVPDELEQKLYEFEAKFGYWREIVKPKRLKDKKEFEATCYLVN